MASHLIKTHHKQMVFLQFCPVVDAVLDVYVISCVVLFALNSCNLTAQFSHLQVIFSSFSLIV